MKSKHFKDKELRCPCCKVNKVNLQSLKKLEKAREIYGKPIYITSAYRCPKHNKKVGGHPKSSHLKGRAFDISHYNTLLLLALSTKSTSKQRFKYLEQVVLQSRGYKLIKALYQAGFRRFGIGTTFIHIDDDPEKPKEVCWIYGNKKR
mgnify:CR=1 FL=1